MYPPIPSHALRHRKSPRRLPALLAVVLVLAGAGIARAQTLDPAFVPSASDTVRAIAVEADGRILIGGQFVSLSGKSRPMLARLAADGTVEAALAASPDDRVLAIAVQDDGRIVIGGNFDSVGGAARTHVARLLADGSVDPGFTSPLPSGAGIGVTDLVVQGNGKIVIAGGFYIISGQPRDGLARLNVDGSLDTGFNPPDFDGAIDAMLVQPDGKVVVAGFLHGLDGACAESYCIARVNATGSQDTTFATVEVVGTVRQLARQDNGRILVAGSFGGLDDFDTYYVGRLGENGGVDRSFSNTALRYSDISRIVPLAGGRILIGGEIRWGTAGSTLDRIARLDENGARDTSFDELALDSMIVTTAVQPDGSILVGGMFTEVDGQPHGRLARLLSDAPDLVFRNGFD